MKKNKPELLAPARSFEGMMTAYKAGADAVYAGGRKFSARAFADNFTDDELKEAIRVSHFFGKKLFLAVNTVLKEDEISKELYDYVLSFYNEGLDACIVQDMGVFSFLRKFFPDMDLHISTQASITNVPGARFFEEAGAARIVTAREISFRDVRAIREETGLEIEAFIHGALCYCYSGQCLFSSMLGSRSGNRGRCAQPCRLPYEVLDRNGKVIGEKGMHPLSLKDMCTVDRLPALIDAGITSFKIEGRMKSLEYVAAVTSVYRKYVDMAWNDSENFKVADADMRLLMDIYNRGGFSKGYYDDHLKKMVSVKGSKRKEEGKEAHRRLEHIRENLQERYLNIEYKKPVTLEFEAKPGEPMTLELRCDVASAKVTGPCPEPASKRAATREDVAKALTALGNTPFVAEETSIRLKGELFLPVGQLKNLRREAVEALEIAVRPSDRKALPYIETKPESGRIRPIDRVEHELIYVSVDTREQLEVVSQENVHRIFLNSATLEPEDLEWALDHLHVPVWLELPTIWSEHFKRFPYRDERISGYLVKNYESWYYMKHQAPDMPLIANWNLYGINSHAIRFLRQEGISETFVPVELNRYEIDRLQERPEILYTYGYLPLMVSRQDVSTTVGRRGEDVILRDRKQVKFQTRRVDRNTTGVIYNSVPLSLIDRYEQLTHRYALFFDFTTETAEQMRRILTYARGEAERPFESFTTGHFKRGID